MGRPSRSSTTGGRLARTGVALALTVGWAFLLQVLPALQPTGLGTATGFDARRAPTAALLRVLAWLAFEALRHAPLGLLAVQALPDRSLRLTRALFTGVPAFLVALATLVVVTRLGLTPAAAPGPVDFVVPSLGIAFGVVAALAWRRGLRAVILLLPRLAAAGVLMAVLGATLLLAALQSQPLAPAPPDVGTADRRRLVAVFRGRNPRRIAPGDTRSLRLTEHDVDQLLAWGLPLVVGPDRVRAAVRLGPQDTVAVQASMRLPRIGRWLNVLASARVRVDEGRLDLAAPRVRVGHLEPPPPLMDALSPFLAAAVREDRRLRAVLPALRDVRVEAGAIQARYGRMEMPPGFLAGLVWGEEAGAALRDEVAAQVGRLLDRLSEVEGDARFVRAFEIAFARAREHSTDASAVEANRAAILALGVVLGHPRIGRLLGIELSDADRRRSARILEGTTLRKRTDWPRHFTVSGALTVLSAVAPSDAAGVLKEELDAERGTGFSFGDLLADRAGTTLAETATRDEISAARMQARLADGFGVDDVFPPATGLPDGIPDEELRSVYGGVGGVVYERYVREIERRVEACAAYRR
jgi:hypothetical protein